MLSFIPIKKGPLFIVIRRGAIVSFSLIIVPCSGIFYTLPFTIISCMLSLLQVSVVIINSKLYVLFIVLKQSGNLNPCYSFQNSLVSEFFLDSFDFKVSQFLCVYTLCGVEQTLSLYLVILRGMRVTPLGVCLRVIANKNPLNLEKTTSICVVINL